MNKTFPFLLAFFISGCSANESFIDPLKPEFETISFDVVQKQLLIETDLPKYLENIISHWFNQRVKIDGFDGDMKFTVLILHRVFLQSAMEKELMYHYLLACF